MNKMLEATNQSLRFCSNRPVSRPFIFTPNESAHRWRPLRVSRIAKPGGRAAIRWSAGFGRILVLWLSGRELKDALPCQPRGRDREEACENQHAHTSRDHNAEVSNFHCPCELLTTAALKQHPSSCYWSQHPPRSQLQRLPN